MSQHFQWKLSYTLCIDKVTIPRRRSFTTLHPALWLMARQVCLCVCVCVCVCVRVCVCVCVHHKYDFIHTLCITVSTENASQNLPNRQTLISWYLVVQVQIEILV